MCLPPLFGSNDLFCAVFIREADRGMIGAVVRLLDDPSPNVRARALGTVHNLSTDARSIGIIREEVGGVTRQEGFLARG